MRQDSNRDRWSWKPVCCRCTTHLNWSRLRDLNPGFLIHNQASLPLDEGGVARVGFEPTTPSL